MVLNFVKLLIFLLLSSAIFTPIVYSGLYLFMDEVHWPFSRVYDRVILLFLIIFVYIKRKEFNIKSLTHEFKKCERLGKVRGFLIGFMITLVPVILAIGILIAMGSLELKDETAGYYTYRFIKLIFTILIVSFLEEIIFRVFLFWQLVKRFGVYQAALLTSVVYAFAHFIVPDKSFKYTDFDLLAGFEYYVAVTAQIISSDYLVSFIIMLIIGLTLCYTLKESKSLFLCAGLHGGWIAGLKLAKIIAYTPDGIAHHDKISQRYYLLTTWPSWLAIATSIVALYLLIRYAYRTTDREQ